MSDLLEVPDFSLTTIPSKEVGVGELLGRDSIRPSKNGDSPNVYPIAGRRHMTKIKMILLGASLVTAVGVARPQSKKEHKPPPKQLSAPSGQETFLKYCASCHGKTAKGDGPSAFVLRTPPPDLTTLSKRHEDKFPAGYVSSVLIFGQSFASHGSEDMPIWGSRFKTLDPVRDPTGQQHIDDVIAYLRSLQVK